MLSTTALYTDLSCYYDLMCADINYEAQSRQIHRLHQLFGNSGKKHLDLACGTGPHVRHFIDLGYQSSGLDINQPMLDIALTRCPEAHFSLGNMCQFSVDSKLDLITCFLYSIHYSNDLAELENCIKSVHVALNKGGIFCFNAVDKTLINNNSFVRHSTEYENSEFTFQSGWFYSGDGDKQALKLSIEKSTQEQTQCWQDEHAMVAVNFKQLTALLSPYFEVHLFEHDYDAIMPWNRRSGNALFACVKI
ncbi:SAM-dependent methyltransferase [Photobacterium jeanii]|uniref:SAM-dependent methyltransferase n=1 Tax=Photobacterium jeanii TaxID=858640 RepID=A0A178K374_9GAMM|nr:class I SAM-dependent methyltransferase [Photobacterium jeanii]OAN11537.1 SAM-dependent methyltransferase [Photobacterium jeanii]PST91056.1 class I SAM-dependent methyltransferase [Photobacterium jeanii]